MITKKTEVNQIEVTQNGTVQIRIKLSVLENGVELNSAWHRTAFYPGCDIDAQFSSVNANLASMQREPVSIADIDKVKAHCTLAWTPQVIAAYQAM